MCVCACARCSQRTHADITADYRELNKAGLPRHATPHMAPLCKQLSEVMRSFHDVLDLGNFFSNPLVTEAKTSWHFSNLSISVQKASYHSNILVF